jgi:hypothetical protein
MDRRIDKRLRGFALSVCLMAGAPLSHADFGPAAKAREWCKKQTLGYLEKRGYIPYNWEATTFLEESKYVTKGIWRVDVDNIKVTCTSDKHARKPSGRYKILGIDIFEHGKSHKH